MSDEIVITKESDGSSAPLKKLDRKQMKSLFKLWRRGNVSSEYLEKFELDKDSFGYMYSSSRVGGLSRLESFYNAAFVSALARFDKTASVSSELTNTFSHPKGWYKNSFHTWRNNVWSHILSLLQSLPHLFTSLKEIPAKTKGAYHKSAAKVDNSFRLFVTLARFTKRCLSVILPALLCVALIISLKTVFSDTVAVDIFINGEYLGIVEDFDIISETKRDLEKTLVSPVDTGVDFDSVITYSLTSGKNFDYLTKTEVYSALYEVAKKEIVPAYGFYIDGTLVAATKNRHALEVIREEINDYFADMQSVFTRGDDIKVVTSNNIVIEEGNFPTSIVKSEKEVRELLGFAPTHDTHEHDHSIYSVCYEFMTKPTLEWKNKSSQSTTLQGIATIVQTNTEYEPDVDTAEEYVTTSKPSLVVLGYKIIKTKTLKETVPFTVEYVETDKYLKGTMSVERVGKNGQRTATYEIAYSDVDEKNELERVLISEVVTKEPVNKIVLVGTRPPTDEEQRTLATGTFIIPYNNYLSSAYGVRTVTKFGTREFHNAWDIPGPYGAKIVAADGGVVCNVSRTSGYGLRVIIDHENGYKTLYAHLSSATVKVGDRVAQGDQIAKMGSSGRVTGVHVHFEIQKDGVTVNPADYMKTPTIRG